MFFARQFFAIRDTVPTFEGRLMLYNSTLRGTSPTLKEKVCFGDVSSVIKGTCPTFEAHIHLLVRCFLRYGAWVLCSGNLLEFGQRVQTNIIPASTPNMLEGNLAQSMFTLGTTT